MEIMPNMIFLILRDYEETVRDVIKRMSEIQKLDLTRDKKLYESFLYHQIYFLTYLNCKI